METKKAKKIERAWRWEDDYERIRRMRISKRQLLRIIPHIEERIQKYPCSLHERKIEYEWGRTKGFPGPFSYGDHSDFGGSEREGYCTFVYEDGTREEIDKSRLERKEDGSEYRSALKWNIVEYEGIDRLIKEKKPRFLVFERYYDDELAHIVVYKIPKDI